MKLRMLRTFLQVFWDYRNGTEGGKGAMHGGGREWMILVMMIMIILETDSYYYPAVNMYSLFFTSLSQSLLFTLASMS